MRAIFVVPLENGSPALPELTDWVNGQARDGSGFSCLGDVPRAGTALVLVDSSEAVIDDMANDSRYLFVEDAP